jgi:hypothetical protein
MTRTALSLRQKTSAWTSWLPYWPTCMCEISREDSLAANDNIFPMAASD